jgi:hypothetical protein
MALLVLFRVPVDEAVDTRGTEGSSSDALAFLASPRALHLAAAEGLDSTGDDGGFGSLLPLLRLAALATAARPRVVTAAAVVIAVPVTIIATVIVAVAQP